MLVIQFGRWQLATSAYEDPDAYLLGDDKGFPPSLTEILLPHIDELRKLMDKNHRHDNQCSTFSALCRYMTSIGKVHPRDIDPARAWVLAGWMALHNGLSKEKVSQIINCLAYHLQVTSLEVPKMITTLTLGHAFVLVMAHEMEARLQKQGKQMHSVIQLQDKALRRLLQPNLAIQGKKFPVDVHKESLIAFERSIFQPSDDGPTWRQDCWGLDAGPHQGMWNPQRDFLEIGGYEISFSDEADPNRRSFLEVWCCLNVDSELTFHSVVLSMQMMTEFAECLNDGLT
jgi:hypothetical protein